MIVPCRNERETLGLCLDALLAQDHPRAATDLIVVDGGSTDGSVEIARTAGARVLADAGVGPGAARNVGIRAARAPIVAFTDADCIPRVDWLTRIAEVFAEDGTLAGVAGGIRMPRDTALGRLEDDEARALYRGLITSNVAYRKDALHAVGGFDESLACAEDYDLAWRLIDEGYRIVHDPRPVVVHAPPELRDGTARYLLKQFWYARNDVPAHLRAMRRHRMGREAAGSASALVDSVGSARDAACALAVGAGVTLRFPGLAAAGVAVALGMSASRVARVRRTCDVPHGEALSRLALITARQLARGAGTLVGYADSLAPSRRNALTTEARVPLAPASTAWAWRAEPRSRALS